MEQIRHVMRKPGLCEQQWRRLACASARSDQRCCLIIILVLDLLLQKVSRILLVSVAETANLEHRFSCDTENVFIS